MHKITKGLKKKKKGKKSKHKEDELFKPEELEAYRREHQQAEQENATATTAGANDEWKKFNALTAGIDTFLKKTQDDLDRIKSTSFFQRVPPPSETKREKELEANQQEEQLEEVRRQEEAVRIEAGIVEVSESESEEAEDEDIFDTTYIDAIAAGEVKLAYIPESPTEEQVGDDPFDTSIADRAILGPAVERKGKKLVPLGAAVEVLTGRVQAPTCVPTKQISTRRTVLKQHDLLLGSFDDNANAIPEDLKVGSQEIKLTLLDEDDPIPLTEPIDLSKNLAPETKVAPVTPIKESPIKNLVEEFDEIDKEENDEFALLAAESLSKVPANLIHPTPTLEPAVNKETWNAFDEEQDAFVESPKAEVDPFDTTFAANILPGKCELKIIEKDILENDLDFNPRAEDKVSDLIKNAVSIQITNPAGRKDTLDKVSESELNAIKPEHRDLLGGSITNLSNLGDQPLKPKEKPDEDYIEYCDPFDTTIVDTATVPGKAELKFLEKELLSDIQQVEESSLSDDEFDPRAEESAKNVAFSLPLRSENDLLTNGVSHKVDKPLTPYYVRKESIAAQLSEEEIDTDPFDTSFVTHVAPGRAELKIIEDELIKPTKHLPHEDFNPRDDKQVAVAKVVQTIEEISNPTKRIKPESINLEKEKIDLLSVDDEVAAKVLTPAAEKPQSEISYSDPFDTSIASNILPGKAELKLLETELIHSTEIPDFDPRAGDIREEKQETTIPNYLERSSDKVDVKPLSPVNNFDIEDEIDVDPLDTSFASNIGPGQTELKLLESELI